MIEQALYIEILELFDILHEEECFVKYIEVQNKLENNKEIIQLINEYNFISNTLTNIDYQPFIDAQTIELNTLEKQINENELYQEYLKLYNVCNNRLVEISRLIFKDIIHVNEGGCQCK